MHFFAKNLEFLRKSRGLSQAEMKAELDFNRTTWNNYETGKSVPYLDGLIKIANYFGVSETELIHVDLSKGNLIPKQEDQKNSEKGNLKGNPKGNPTATFKAGKTTDKGALNEPVTQAEFEDLKGKVDDLMSANAALLAELRKLKPKK